MKVWTRCIPLAWYVEKQLQQQQQQQQQQQGSSSGVQPQQKCSRQLKGTVGQAAATPAVPTPLAADQAAAAPAAPTHLDKLDDHLLRAVLEWLSDQDLLKCMAAGLPRLAAAAADVKQRHEQVCFFSKLAYTETGKGCGCVLLVMCLQQGSHIASLPPCVQCSTSCACIGSQQLHAIAVQ
jgi:hypothetical protein